MEAWEETQRFHEEEPERPPSRTSVRFATGDEPVFPDGREVDRDEDEIKADVDVMRETRSREGPRARFADPTPVKGQPMSSHYVDEEETSDEESINDVDACATTLQARYRGHAERSQRLTEAKMATTLQAAERGRQGRIMVGKSARKPRRPSLEIEQPSVQSETDDEAVFDVVEQRVDALFEESLPAPDVPATPPRSPLREKAAALSPEIEKVVVEAEAMEREAQVKEELAEKLKLEVEELASRAKEAEEKRALSSARRHQAEAELEKLKPETEELERQLAARRERRRSLQAASPPTSPS